MDTGIISGPDQAREGTETSSNATRGLITIRQRFAELAGRLEELDSTIRPNRLNAEAPRRRSPGLFGPRPPADQSVSPINPPRRAYNLSSLYARQSNSDDPTTLLGRRVEARESALRASSSDNVRSDLQDFMDAADHSLTLLARHGQQLLASSREFRQSIPGISSEASEDPRPFAVALPPPPAPHPPAIRPFSSRERSALWRQNMRDRRPLSSSDDRSGIIISLRRTDGDNSPRSPPLTSAHGPSDGQLRASSTTDMPDLTDLTDDEVDDPTSRRSYRVRRRLNPEGGVDTVVDEVTSRLSWDSWQSVHRRPRSAWLGLSPARIWPDSPSYEGGSATGNDERTYFLNSDGSMDSQDDISFSTVPRRARTRRRRGWGESFPTTLPSFHVDMSCSARLDQDGNEIPTDEEEEYERSRTHMRVRAQALTQRRRTSLAAARSLEATTLPPPPPPAIANSAIPIANFLREYSSYPDSDLTPIQSPTFRPRPTSRDSISSYVPSIVAGDHPDHDGAAMATTPFEPNPLPWPPLTLPSTPVPQVRQKREVPQARYSLWSPFAGR